MARGIPCDMCGAGEGDMLITNMHDGDTMGVCMGCLVVFAKAIEQTMAPAPEPEPTGETTASDSVNPNGFRDVDVTPSPQVIEEMEDWPETGDGAVPATKPKSRTRKRQSTAEGQGETQVPEEGQTADVVR